jgi:ABC-type phosphate transport system ATPase subunit
MDVLALRKTSGEMVGEIGLNGHEIDPGSFRRCTGYVEQFDVQSPQLTIRETVIFSARLRLEESDPVVTPENIILFVDQTLHMLELKPIEDLQVGDDESGGLSFEQRKRLSIAVELVSNPSVLFLDEPTSGTLLICCSLFYFHHLLNIVPFRFGCPFCCRRDARPEENRTYGKGGLRNHPPALECNFSRV